MPTYQYACRDCGHELEAVQSFTDEPLTVCPACAGTLRKRFSAVGVVFKGSGFYRTDSREKPPAKAGTNGSGTASAAKGTETPKTDAGTADSAAKPAKKPDAAKPAAATSS